jgi:integrase/recombinase XerD
VVQRPEVRERGREGGAALRLTEAIDLFLEAKRHQGAINSNVSERSYRDVLLWLAECVENRDPRYINREDIIGALRRWPYPNTRANRRSYYVSFCDWLMEEGYRPDNPARQTPKPKRRPTSVYRLTLDETTRLLAAAQTPRERRAIYLCVCAGLRNQEVRGLQGRHFERDGWIRVTADIAKGGKERSVPTLPDLVPVIAEIRRNCGPDDFILPAMRIGNPGVNTRQTEHPQRACSQQSLGELVARVAKRAGISQHIYPHLLRHAFADFIARYAGMRNAQFLLGHSAVSTTETYLGQPTLDELAQAIKGFSFASESKHTFQGVLQQTVNLDVPRAGFEPATEALRPLERDVAKNVSDLLLSPEFRKAARESFVEVPL